MNKLLILIALFVIGCEVKEEVHVHTATPTPTPTPTPTAVPL